MLARASIAIALSACTIGEELPPSRPGPGVGCAGGFAIDGAFGNMDDPGCAEWDGVTPLTGRFGDLYVRVDETSRLIVLNDWHLRDDAPAEPEMYNLFCLATDLGVFEVRVFGDHHVEAWLDGESIDGIEGAAGFGASPTDERPHTIFELALATLPSEMRVMECDPAGGTMQVPAPPPGVYLATEAGCFPGSGRDMPHNLVREPTIFDLELGPEGVRRASTTSAPVLLGASTRRVEPGAELIIYGAQLGAAGTVRVEGREIETIEWTDSRVTLRAPPEPSGPVRLDVSAGGHTSNALWLWVEACSPACGEGYVCDASRTCVPVVVD